MFAGAQTVDGRDISADLDQAVKIASSPQFAGLTIRKSGETLINIVNDDIPARYLSFGVTPNYGGTGHECAFLDFTGVASVFRYNKDDSLLYLPKAGTIEANAYKSSDGSSGATGSFTSADGKTVTVKNGLITAIV